MKWGGLAPSHVLSVYIDRIHQFLHPGHVPIPAGLKQLPESPTRPAAAASRTGTTGVGSGARTTAPAGGRRASAARAGAAAAAGAEERSGNISSDLRFPDALGLPTNCKAAGVGG